MCLSEEEEDPGCHHLEREGSYFSGSGCGHSLRWESGLWTDQGSRDMSCFIFGPQTDLCGVAALPSQDGCVMKTSASRMLPGACGPPHRPRRFQTWRLPSFPRRLLLGTAKGGFLILMRGEECPSAWLRVIPFALQPRCMIQLGLHGMGLLLSVGLEMSLP